MTTKRPVTKKTKTATKAKKTLQAAAKSKASKAKAAAKAPKKTRKPAKKAAKKNTRAQAKAEQVVSKHPQPDRVLRALELVVAHGTPRRRFVVETLIEEYDISTRTADTDWAKAKAILLESAKDLADEHLARVAEAAWDQFRKADAEGDRKGTGTHLSILQRLFGKTKLELGGEVQTTGVLVVPAVRPLEEG